MGARKGVLFEKNLERIFKLAGFRTQRNIKINGYEIDVTAEFEDLLIAVQCKQYETSYINVKDLVHQWDSKNKKIDADRVIIAIFGQELTKEERGLAKNFNMIIWDERDVDRYDDLVTDKGKTSREHILSDLGLLEKSKGLKEYYAQPIITIDEIEEKVSGITTIKKIEAETFFSPVLLTKVNVSYNNDDFNFKKDYSFYTDLSNKEKNVIDNVNIDKDRLLITKQKGKYQKVSLSVESIEDFLIKKSIDNAKSKYYYSTLKSRFSELEGTYKESKKEIFDTVRNVFLGEIEEKIENAKYKYTPRIELIEEEIQDIKHEIDHLEDVQSELKGTFWGYKGETDSEKRRNKERYENIGFKVERKELKIEQLNSKIGIIKKHLQDEINVINDRYDRIVENSIETYEFLPEKYDCSVIEKILYWIPRLVGSIETSGDLINFEVDHKRVEKIGECHKCKLEFKDIKEIKPCEICNKIYCSLHIIKCHECGKSVCEKDSWNCMICDKTYCKNEKSIICNSCNNEFCNKCVGKCHICSSNFCKKHIIKCNVCGKPTCRKDSKPCHICENLTCKKCFVECKGCKKQACKDDFINCPNCDSTTCKGCTRFKRKFLIIKKQRCVFCIDEK